jgi:hypothetical protein
MGKTTYFEVPVELQYTATTIAAVTKLNDTTSSPKDVNVRPLHLLYREVEGPDLAGA